ncbi:MAG: nucleotide exchange factor GrpE [Parachlamydiaceae bacterium]|nr:nucleotide exchange factor GrpE [Parachlamydiaceae bacterium]
MKNSHKHDHDKDHSQDPTFTKDQEAAINGAEAPVSDSDKKSHEKKQTHAEENKIASEPKREPKNVTITDIELEKLKNEVAEFKDKYLRVLAESENSRKRLQKEKQETIQYALENVIVDFLNPIDHMENALKYTQQMSDEVKHWAIGFQMILTQFKDVLTNNGVTSFDSEGKPFDPHSHEAVEVVISKDVPPNTVINETLKGYKIGSNNRVIRPARVKVSKSPTEENETDQNETIE